MGPSQCADQGVRGSVSTRDYPLVTPSNSTAAGAVTRAGLALLVLPKEAHAAGDRKPSLFRTIIHAGFSG